MVSKKKYYLSYLVNKNLHDYSRGTRMNEMKNFRHHRTVSVYDHSVHVAYLSLYLANKLHLEYDEDALIKGSLFHDYFLYDWHEDNHKRPHGFTHPKQAYLNAIEDIEVNDKERKIITRHMFPLTPIPPTSKEGWLVCIADKICALREMINLFPFRYVE